MAKRNKTLVIAAHPDDEVLGCGATIAKYAAKGADVRILILSEGATARDSTRDRQKHAKELRALNLAAQKAAKILGATSVTLLGFPDNRLDGTDLLDVVKSIETVTSSFKPDTVFTHAKGDVNVDHRITHEAVLTACRATPGQSVRELFFFETPSSTEWRPPCDGETFAPNWFEDVSKTLSLKLKALNVYAAEMRPWPHPRSLRAVEALARWRGASNGVAAAEAFVLGRKLA